VTLAADSPIEEEFVWTMRNVGIDYLLLGSDFPQLTLPQTLRALDRLGLSKSEKAKIRFGNASRLLRLHASEQRLHASDKPAWVGLPSRRWSIEGTGALLRREARVGMGR